MTFHKIIRFFVKGMADRLRVTVVENRLDRTLIFSVVTDLLREDDPRRVRLENVLNDLDDNEFDDLAIRCLNLVRHTMVYIPIRNQDGSRLGRTVHEDNGLFTITQDVLAGEIYDVYLHITYNNRI